MTLQDPTPLRRLAVPAALVAGFVLVTTACGGALAWDFARMSTSPIVCLTPHGTRFAVRTGVQWKGCDTDGLRFTGGYVVVDVNGQFQSFDVPSGAAIVAVHIDPATGDAELERADGPVRFRQRPDLVDRRFVARPPGKNVLYLLADGTEDHFTMVTF